MLAGVLLRPWLEFATELQPCCIRMILTSEGHAIMKPRYRGRAFGILLILLVHAWCSTSHAQTVDLTLLHFNDAYEISAKNGVGGLSPFMTLLERERAKAKHHLTTFGGDLISPSVISGITKGKHMIALMNALGVDIAGLGNHEFDFGKAILRQRMRESQFTWLATNALSDDGKPFGTAKTLIVRDVGGLKIGMFGLLTPDTNLTLRPSEKVRFTPPVETARRSVSALRKMGADFLIAITHQYISQDRELARRVGGIGVILGGHEHDPIAIYEGGTLIMKAGQDARYLAVADLRIDKKDTGHGSRVSMLPQWRFISTAGVTPHPGIASLVRQMEADTDEILKSPVAKTAVALDSRRAAMRTRETAFGNMVIDAMRAAVGAEIGLTNAGGFRGNRIYDAGTRLTRKDIFSELPFGNVTVMLAIFGADLWAVLEHAVSAFGQRSGRFVQVSGLKFTFDPSRPVGRRVLEVVIGGKPLDKGRTYTLATNNYLARGGDGYEVLKRAKPIIDASDGKLMASQVVEHLSRMGVVAPGIEGRIQVKQ